MLSALKFAKGALSALLTLSLSTYALVPIAYANEEEPVNPPTSLTQPETPLGEDQVSAEIDELQAPSEEGEENTPAVEGELPAADQPEAVGEENGQEASDAEEDDEELEAQSIPERTVADGVYYIGVALNSSQVLDLANGSVSNGGNVQLFQSNLTPAQRFRVTYDEATGFYTIKSVKSGLVLDVAGGNDAPGANIQQYQSNGTLAQQWVISERPDGAYTIASALEQSLVLDAAGGESSNGTNIQLYTSNDTLAQGFYFASTIMPRTVDDGTYYISSLLSPERVIDIAGGSTSNGANVQMYQANSSAAQRFQVTYDASTGLYDIICEKSGKALDIPSAEVYGGANVQQYQANGTDAQKWVITLRSDGAYTLRAALDPSKVMDVESASTAYGANVQLWWANESAGQGFEFTPAIVPSVSESTVSLTDGNYVISSMMDSNFVLDITGGSMDSGAVVQLYGGNGTWAQMFTVEKVGGYYRLTNLKSGKALECNFGSVIPGTSIAQYNSNGSDAQLWAINENSNGGYTLTNKASGLCIAVDGNSATYGATIESRKNADSVNQAFQMTEVGNLLKPGIYSLRSAMDDSKTLDVARGSFAATANVQLYVYNTTFAQKWRMEAVAGERDIYTFQSINSGLYLGDLGGNVCQIAKAGDGGDQWRLSAVLGDCAFVNVKTGKALTVDGSASNGVNVVTADKDNSVKQRFLLEGEQFITDGYYNIVGVYADGMVAEVHDSSMDNGALVGMLEENGQGNQIWYFEENSDGSYTITNALSGKVMDVRNGDAVEGTAIQQYQSNDTAAQKWIPGASNAGMTFASAKNSSLALNYDKGLLRLSASASPFTLVATSWNPKPQHEIDLDNVAYGMSSNTNWLILVDTESCYTAVYYGSQYNWEPVKYILCGPGAPWSPTVMGHYTVTGRGYCFHGYEDNGDHYTCYYYTQFYGDYLFHSIVYWYDTFDPYDDTLGEKVSHGCVRMELENAKWIYDTIPNGSHVFIY